MAAPAASFESLNTLHAVADHARFFTSWLRRIAPDTHQDQAGGDERSAAAGRAEQMKRRVWFPATGQHQGMDVPQRPGGRVMIFRANSMGYLDISKAGMNRSDVMVFPF